MEERELDRETDYVVVINPQKWREGHIVVSIHREREREGKRERKRWDESDVYNWYLKRASPINWGLSKGKVITCVNILEQVTPLVKTQPQPPL